VEGNPRNLEKMCLCGLVPYMMRFGSAYYSREFSVEVAFLIGQIFSLSNLAQQVSIIIFSINAIDVYRK
jgi:hypothetical protein